jgi:DNA-binding transcriptional ArsR family regulator
MQSSEGIWLSITDYSSYKGISISTVRRHIKSNIVRYKEEHGKYFIYLADEKKLSTKLDGEILRLRLENEWLKREQQKLTEEIVGLKMLIDAYEINFKLEQAVPPPLPEIS